MNEIQNPKQNLAHLDIGIWNLFGFRNLTFVISRQSQSYALYTFTLVE